MLFSTSLMLAGHFGFNTNLLETNVLNLAVVLAIVITYVGDALRGLLANRKQTILNNFLPYTIFDRLTSIQCFLFIVCNDTMMVRQQGGMMKIDCLINYLKSYFDI